MLFLKTGRQRLKNEMIFATKTPRHEVFLVIILSLCLGALVANPSGSSGLGIIVDRFGS